MIGLKNGVLLINHFHFLEKVHFIFIYFFIYFISLGEIGDWLNHFDVQQSKEYDQMVSNRLSPLIPPLNYGISLEDQQNIYNLDKKQNSFQTS